MDDRDIQKLLKFLISDDDDEETRQQAIKMLQELTGVSVKELDVAAIAKELDALSPEQKAKARDLLARYRERIVLKEKGGRHPLSGLLGGPGANEGGPQPLEVIGKEQRRDITNLVLKELGKGSVRIPITDRVTLLSGPMSFRVTLKGVHSAPDGFIRDPDGAWSAEVHKTLDVAESLGNAIAAVVKALAHERRGTRSPQHPLSGWQFMGRSQSTPMVITNKR